MHVRHSLVIESPPEQVFSWIEHPQRARMWQPDVGDAEVLQATPGMVGTVFREVLRDSRGSVEMQGRITEFEPGRSMAVHLQGQGLSVDARYEVAPHPQGTLLHAEQTVVLPGRFARLVEPLVRRRVARRGAADLQRLKRLCEDRAATPPPEPGESG